MLTKNIQDQLNKQVNEEFYSSYLYLAMAAYFEDCQLTGFAAWMKAQAKEELTHAMKFYDHIFNRNGKTTLATIEAPKASWASPLAAIEDAYKHEQHISKLISGLVELARAEKDYATEAFLQWFVTEQVEEEELVNKVVAKMKLLSDAPGGLFFMDREMSARV